MIKRIFILIALLSLNGLARVQQFSPKDLNGRWQTTKNNHTNDLAFLTDSTAAFATADGLVYDYIAYTTQVKKDVMWFKYTIDINRAKHRNITLSEIKFLNDSTFLQRFTGLTSWKTDTGNKNIRLYHKLKSEKPGTALHNATYKNIQGVWTNYFKNDPHDIHIIFRDSRRAEFSQNGHAAELVYSADFTKQPVPLDFYYPGTQKTLQAFLVILGKDNLRIEFFPKNNRGDHLTIFGDNTSFRRDTTLIPDTAKRRL